MLLACSRLIGPERVCGWDLLLFCDGTENGGCLETFMPIGFAVLVTQRKCFSMAELVRLQISVVK